MGGGVPGAPTLDSQIKTRDMGHSLLQTMRQGEGRKVCGSRLALEEVGHVLSLGIQHLSWWGLATSSHRQLRPFPHWVVLDGSNSVGGSSRSH